MGLWVAAHDPSETGGITATGLATLREGGRLGLADGNKAARARSNGIDAALASMVKDTLGAQPSLTVVAVGGYGRGEMSPHSDVDLLLLIPPRREPPAAAVRGLLYPLWDSGFEVGHATVTPRAALERAAELDAATSLLSARLVAGNEKLFEELVDRRKRWTKRNSRRLARHILDSVARRHAHVDRAGWTLAPDLKTDAGGLRDLHAIAWLAQLREEEIDDRFDHPRDVLLAVREALHLHEGRRFDRVRIDLQPALAQRLGFEGQDGRDEMMAELHSAARFVEYHGAAAIQESFGALTRGPARSGSMQRISATVSMVDGELLAAPASAEDIDGAMQVIVAAAGTGKLPARSTTGQLHKAFATPAPSRWGPDTRRLFAQILEAERCVAALELLDHLGAWTALLPEWEQVRGLAQHDPYHRYTVDGHSFRVIAGIRTAIEEDPVARSAALEAGSLEALYVAALLHDVGKGTGQDHCVAGAEIATKVCDRMGLEAGDTDTIVALVRNHLLLVDTAARRNIADPEVITAVGETLGDPRLARLLYVLTVADGMGTGPDGWSSWKASLVRRLYVKVIEALESTAGHPSTGHEVSRLYPAIAKTDEGLLETLPGAYRLSGSSEELAEELGLLAQVEGRDAIATATRPGAHPTIVLAGPDRPGALARTAGVLALHRLGVLHAEAFSTTRGLALQRFVIDAPPASWRPVIEDLDAAYLGVLALDARLEQKIVDYRPKRPPGCRISVLEDESRHSTVVEVRAEDALGLLYAVASALTGLDLDIQVAKIDTLGSRVVDAFYVRTAAGAKLPPGKTGEIEEAVRHRIRVFFGG